MAVQFIIGRAGSGKTHVLRERLVTHVSADPLNACVIYLVPKQTTFNTQRAIAADPRLGGFCNVRVIAPDDLAEIALIETGRPLRARLDGAGRALIIGHLLRLHADDLQHFGRSAGSAGLAREVDQAFGEFERAGKDIGALENDAEADTSAGPSQQNLFRKIADLKLIYEKYQAFLREHQFDLYERQLKAPEAIQAWAGARGALLLVDDFYDFTAYERQLIVALARVAKDTLISVMMETTSPLLRSPDLMPSAMGLFYRTESMYRSLYFDLQTAHINPIEPMLRTSQLRWKESALRAIERCLDPRPPAKVKARGTVHMLLSPDAAGELHTAAREIQRLLSEGFRLRDICVLARSVDGYADSIDAVFAEYNIPFFLDRRRDALHHPLTKTLQGILQIVLTRWSHESVFELLKGGLTPLETDAIDLLQAYVNEHRLLPVCWRDGDDWQYARTEFDDADHHALFTPAEVHAADVARSLVVQAMGAMGQTQWADEERPLRAHMADLFAVLERLRVRPSMLKRIQRAEADHRQEQRAEEEQIWSEWISLADQLVDLLGDVALTGQAFAEQMQTAVAGLELAITPPTIDQVLVGAIDRTRTGPVRATIVLGMNECQFPLCERERAVLNDADRGQLLRRGIEIERPSGDALMMERFLGYLALSRASEQIILIRVMRDRDGNAQQPSPYWDAVEQVVQDPIATVPADAIERIATTRQAVSHVLKWARTHADAGADADSASLYQWLTTDAGEGTRYVRDRAWPSLRYRNLATLSPGVATELFSSPLNASVSRFESFAACPFQHFARHGLRLQRATETEFTAMDLGTLYHAVLETVVADVLRQRVDFATEHELTPLRIRQIAQDVSGSLSNQIFLSSARNRFTLEQLETVIHKLVRSQQVQLGGGEFRPAFTELTFGDRKRLPPVELTTPNGHVVKLRGKIDRIDLNPSGDVFSVIDYKLGGKTLDYSHVAHRLMLQLLTYLLVLKQHGESLTKRPLTAAGALYVKVLRSIGSVDHPANAPVPESEPFHLKEQPRGVISRTHAARFDAALAGGGVSKLVSVKIKKDGSFYEKGNDAVEQEDFDALVRFVERQIVLMADSIIDGDIKVDPYIIGKETACQHCDLRRVCRFDRAVNGYRPLAALSREEALTQIRIDGGPLQ